MRRSTFSREDDAIILANLHHKPKYIASLLPSKQYGAIFARIRKLKQLKGVHMSKDKKSTSGVVVQQEAGKMTTFSEDVGGLSDKIKYQQLKEKYDKIVQDKVLEENIIENIIKYIKAYPCQPCTYKGSKKAEGKSVEEMVFMLSDTHIGETVSFEETQGLCVYNMDIFEKRFNFIIDTIISIVNKLRHGYTIDKLNVHALGDMVSGIIHQELVETAEGTIIEWLLDGADIVAKGMLKLAQNFKEISFTGVVGNHGRMDKKPTFKRKYVNWDYLFYEILRMKCAKQSNISFNIPKSFFTVDKILGWDFLLLHGDNINSWQGIPFYGIKRAAANLSEVLSSHDRKFDYIELGHFHSTGLLDRVVGEILINGSFKGGDEYSIGKMFTMSQPKQTIFGVHKKQGKTWSYNLKCDSK